MEQGLHCSVGVNSKICMSAKIYRSGDGFLRIHWGFIPFHFVSGEVRVNATRLAFLFPSTLKGKSGVAGRRRFPTLSSVKKPAKIRKAHSVVFSVSCSICPIPIEKCPTRIEKSRGPS